MRCQEERVERVGVGVGGVGVGFEILSLVLQRSYVRNYGNMTVNYDDSMKQQDGMNYRRSTLLQRFSCSLRYCPHNVNLASDTPQKHIG